MKTEFEKRITDVAQEAMNFIKAALLKKKKYVFLTQKEREEDVDKMYELPIASKVTKHGFYDEFAILSIKNKDGIITVSGACKGEGDDEDEISIDNVGSVDLCAVADLIGKQIK